MIALMISVIVHVINVQLSAPADNRETRGIRGTGSSMFLVVRSFFPDRQRQNCMAIRIEKRGWMGQQSDVGPNLA